MPIDIPPVLQANHLESSLGSIAGADIHLPLAFPTPSTSPVQRHSSHFFKHSSTPSNATTIESFIPSPEITNVPLETCVYSLSASIQYVFEHPFSTASKIAVWSSPRGWKKILSPVSETPEHGQDSAGLSWFWWVEYVLKMHNSSFKRKLPPFGGGLQAFTLELWVASEAMEMWYVTPKKQERLYPISPCWMVTVTRGIDVDMARGCF